MNDESHHILIVEDSSDDLTLLQRALRKAEINNPLHIVADGESALSYLSGEGPFADRAAHPLPWLVLLDLRLPRKSGFEVLLWIRRDPDLHRIPVIVLSNLDNDADLHRARSMGASSYLLKPIAFDQLHEMIELLSQNRTLNLSSSSEGHAIAAE